MYVLTDSTAKQHDEERRPVTEEPEDPFHHLRIPPPIYLSHSTAAATDPTDDSTVTTGTTSNPPPYSSYSIPGVSTAIQMEPITSHTQGLGSFQSKWPNQSRGAMFDFDVDRGSSVATQQGYPRVSAVTTSAQMRAGQSRSPTDKIPSDYMAWSVFSMLCCCFCFGIGAVYSSAETKSYVMRV